MIKNYIFLGPPGVGKGTLAKKLAQSGPLHISTGEIFRLEIANKSNLGLKIKEIIETGKYVPDDITNEIVKKRLSKSDVKQHGFILDGYPRTIDQAQFLKDNNFKIDKVILLDASKELIMERLINRKRSDDNQTAIKARLQIYNDKTKPLINFYIEEKLLVKIDASSSIENNFLNLNKGIS